MRRELKYMNQSEWKVSDVGDLGDAKCQYLTNENAEDGITDGLMGNGNPSINSIGGVIVSWVY